MIRIVLVGWDEGDWRVYRQEQWMAEVRRNASAASLARVHFDIDEASYRSLQLTWTSAVEGSSRTTAMERLTRAGAVEVRSPRS